MERKKSKRILYSICFICFVFIDWIRGSQDGVYWQAAINLTGMLVSILMISHFSWKKEPSKTYLIWLALWILGSVVGYVIWHTYPDSLHPTKYWAAAISVCFVGVSAIRIWRARKELEGTTLGNPILLASWVIMSVLMSCSEMAEIWPLWYAFIFLLFYMVPFSQEESNDLWNGLANGVIAAFFMLQIWAYGFRHYDEMRYDGAYSNYNMNALFYMVTYIALLYRSHSLRWREKREECKGTWKSKTAKWILWLLTVGMWSFVFLTMTRTAYLVIVGITIIYGFIEFRIYYKEKYTKIMARGIAFVLGIGLVFPAVYLTVRYLPTILHHPVWLQGEYSVDKVHSFDPPDSEKYTSIDEVFGSISERLGVGGEENNANTDMGGEEDNVNTGKIETKYPLLVTSQISGEMIQTAKEQELLTGAAAENSILVRFEIAKKYLQNMTLTGHRLNEGYFQITPTYHAWHAQNVFLQVGFYYGIIAGILCVVLIVGLGIQTLRIAFRKERCEALLPLLVWFLFVGYGMFECVWHPGQTILLLMYLMPKILIDSRKSINKEK